MQEHITNTDAQPILSWCPREAASVQKPTVPRYSEDSRTQHASRSWGLVSLGASGGKGEGLENSTIIGVQIAVAMVRCPKEEAAINMGSRGETGRRGVENKVFNSVSSRK